jgi:GWxTD domain-containing protein
MDRRMSSVICSAAVIAAMAAGMLMVVEGCGDTSALDLPNRGKSLVSLPGEMSFDVECIPRLTAASPFIDVVWAIPPTSLTFVKEGNRFLAIVDVTVRLRRADGGELVRDISWHDTTAVQSYALTRGSDPIEGSRRVAVPSGLFVVEMVMEDVQTRSTATRFQTVRIPDTVSTIPQEGGIFLEWRHPDGRFAPFVLFHVPLGLDSLRAAVQMFHLVPDRPVPVHVVFERFKGDTTVPLPPYAYLINTNQVSRYAVIDFDRTDTVLVGDVVLHPTGPAAGFTYPLPVARPGLYRITALFQARDVLGDTVVPVKRSVSIKGVTFPRPSTLRELIDGLEYVAKPEELEEIRASRTATEERDRFDVFWLGRTGDRESAAALIRAYYTRVEEANRYFSTIKEGWKTDRGMVYVVLGSPAEISSTPQGQTWQYNFPGGSGSIPFVFRRVFIQGEGIALDEYVLMRQPEYEALWDRMVSRWRRGEYFW